MKRIGIVITVILILCGTASGYVMWCNHAEKQRVVDAKAFIDIFHYIAGHEDREFDYIAVAKELKLSEDELVSYLFALERAGKIKVTPRYSARKPIVISQSDREWFFHRVTFPHTEVPAPPSLPDR